MDEYRRALDEFEAVIRGLDATTLEETRDPAAETLTSLRLILEHTIRAGFYYADALRQSFGTEPGPSSYEATDGAQVCERLDAMFAYTEETLDGRWEMTEKEMGETVVDTSWAKYDVEGILEHAIVHILRHRRQIERML